MTTTGPAFCMHCGAEHALVPPGGDCQRCGAKLVVDLTRDAPEHISRALAVSQARERAGWQMLLLVLGGLAVAAFVWWTFGLGR